MLDDLILWSYWDVWMAPRSGRLTSVPSGTPGPEQEAYVQVLSKARSGAMTTDWLELETTTRH